MSDMKSIRVWDARSPAREEISNSVRDGPLDRRSSATLSGERYAPSDCL